MESNCILNRKKTKTNNSQQINVYRIQCEESRIKWLDICLEKIKGKPVVKNITYQISIISAFFTKGGNDNKLKLVFFMKFSGP